MIIQLFNSNIKIAESYSRENYVLRLRNKYFLQKNFAELLSLNIDLFLKEIHILF